MANKYLDLAGLSVFKNKLTQLIPTKTSNLTNDSNFVVDASYVHTDNNYTSTEKSKLSGIEANAQVNVLEAVKVNGTAQTITDKAVDITVPTKTSDLTNDGDGNSNYYLKSNVSNMALNWTNDGPTVKYGSGFPLPLETLLNKTTVIKSTSTNTQYPTAKAVYDAIPTNNNQLTNGAGYQTSAQVQTAINNSLADITEIDFQVVTTLPATGVKGTIYLISNSGSSTNAYDEYIYVNNNWEKIGTTDVDLSDYMKFTDMVAITTSEINALFA